MSRIKPLKNPFVLVPLIVGTVLPCVVFLILHFSYPAHSQSKLVLKDAVVIAGQSLPKTDLLELDGKSVQPDTLRKGKVLLMFLTTQCEACQKELKLVSRVESEISDRVRIYGVGIESPSQILDYTTQNSIKTKVLLDKDAKLMKSLSVKYFPTKFLLEDGIIVKTWFGNSVDQADLFKELGL